MQARLGGIESTCQLGCLTIMQGPKWQKGHGGSVGVPPSQGQGGGGGGGGALKPLGAINHDQMI